MSGVPMQPQPAPTRRNLTVEAAAARYLTRTGNADLIPILGLDRPHLTAEPDLTAMDTGSALRVLRKRRGISQAALAERCGLSQDAVSKLETGRRPVSGELYERLVDALHAT